jgi:hypothetical protein
MRLGEASRLKLRLGEEVNGCKVRGDEVRSGGVR